MGLHGNVRHSSFSFLTITVCLRIAADAVCANHIPLTLTTQFRFDRMKLSPSTDKPKLKLMVLGGQLYTLEFMVVLTRRQLSRLAALSGKTSLISKYCSHRPSLPGYNPTIHGLCIPHLKYCAHV